MTLRKAWNAPLAPATGHDDPGLLPGWPLGRVPAGEIEAAVIDQPRAVGGRTAGATGQVSFGPIG